MIDDKVIYNKLVRDRIVDIVHSKGKVPTYRTLNEREFEHHLKLKLIEECHELFKAESNEEFLKEAADILEVLHTIAAARSVNWSDVLEHMSARREERGGFENRTLLQSVGDAHAKAVYFPPGPIIPCLITKHSDLTLLDIIKRELRDAIAVNIASAFCSRGMLNLLMDPLIDFSKRGGELRLLTSIMGNFNNPDDLEHVKKVVPDIQMRIFYPSADGDIRDFSVEPPPFHLKCYLFEKLQEQYSLIIGSSNLTEGGLTRNHEWNYFSNSEVNLPLDGEFSPFSRAQSEFEKYWKVDSIPLTEDFLDIYRPRWEKARRFSRDALLSIRQVMGERIEPRPAQRNALELLQKKRSRGIKKTAVIAATGIGKTYLAAFDFKESSHQNILFVAHRENILRKACDSFRRVLRDQQFGVILSGSTTDQDWNKATADGASVFGMIQTLSKSSRLQSFPADSFDYLVIDEFHHSEANSYLRLLEWFEPKFLLGLTATPERMDGRDILKHCDYDVAYEIRLFDAIESGWLVPFQYFAIYDSTDYSDISWTGWGYDEEELDRVLIDDTRAQLVVRNVRKFLPATDKIRALAFCSTKAHAQFMDRKFNELGLPSVCLLGEDSPDAREEAIERLEDENDSLRVICSVEVFGEGVDIPQVSHVLFLRPTQSFTVFLQQLGRGLRPVPEKDYLVVLDFVGNFRQSYVAPLALQGYHSVQEYIETPLKERSRRPPGGCYVSPDTNVQRIWDEEIKSALKKANRRYVLEHLYWELRENVGYSPNIIDFFANPEAHDPYSFVKEFGGWLRAKSHMGDLTTYESTLLDTPGDDFLVHIEKDLRHVRSFKMVVLDWLMQTDPDLYEWTVADIALGFKRYFLDHPEHLHDYVEMARSADPQEFSLKRVASKLRQMPLNYLSDKEDKKFIFDREQDLFILKPEVVPYWSQKEYRELVQDRITFALKRYFYRKYENEQ